MLDLENVVIANCILDTPLGGVRFGPSGEQSVLRNITVSNCVIRHAGKGLLFSLWHGASGRNGCLIENVRISNLVIHADAPLRMYIMDGAAARMVVSAGFIFPVLPLSETIPAHCSEAGTECLRMFASATSI